MHELGDKCAVEGTSQRELLQRRVFRFVTGSEGEDVATGAFVARSAWKRKTKCQQLEYSKLVKYEADFG